MPQGWEGAEEEGLVLSGLESLPLHYKEIKMHAFLNDKPKEKNHE